MLKKLKQGLKPLGILLSSIFILCTPLISFAEDIVIPIADAKKMVVELERSSLYERQVVLIEKANSQLVDQNTLLMEQNIILKEQVKLKQDQLDLSAKELENQKKVYEDKIKVYEKDKGNIWDKVFIAVGGIGIGILAGAVLVLLL